MPTPLRRRLRLARRGAFYGVAIVLVLVAVLLGAASQVLPLAESHPDRVAAWLSQRAGRAVAFDKVETQWTRRGPLLRLDGLRIGEGSQAFTIGDAEMLVSVYAGLLPGQSFSELRLKGLDLTLERGDDGRWKVRGLPGQQDARQRDPLSALEGLGELQVIDGRLAVIAPSLGIDARVPKIDLRLRVDGKRVRAGVRAWPTVGVGGAPSTPLDAVVDFDRERGDGRAYAGATRADLTGWSPLLKLAGIRVESGQGRAEAWAELRDHRVASVTVSAALDRVGLRAERAQPAAPPAADARVDFEHVETLSRWRLTDTGWRFDASKLRIGSGEKVQTLDGLAVAGGEQYALRAERIDAGPLIAVAALSDALPERLRNWFETAKPRASLRDIAFNGRRNGPIYASAKIEALGFDAVGDAPGLQGLAGRFEGDGDGFTLELDEASPMRFDWPRGFGVPHTVKLQGRVGGWREGAGWRVGTTALRVRGEDFGLSARGGLWWQGDGTRPWIDIATDIDPTQVPVAKGFWIRHRMSAKLVNWLDTALVGGRLTGARAVISGDLDDWPFNRNNGLFEASAKLEGAAVKFQPEWPAVEGLDADVRFVADGFSVEGSGRIAGVGVRKIGAGIDHYKDGHLRVQAEAAADAAQLQALLKQSPLRKDHADTLDHLRASGPARVGFEMQMPLRPNSATRIAGTVDLDNAKLADPRWKIAFEQVRGHAEYGRGGFRAEDLAVMHEGAPGKLSLRAGEEFVRDRGNAFEAGLDVVSGADELIARGPDELAWLKAYLDGRSLWTVGISIPRTARAAGATPTSGVSAPTPTLLRLQSNLVGTALSLPPPLDKAGAASLPATVETPLPLGSGDVRVGLGNVLALRARTVAGKTGVRVVLGANRVDEAPPANGLIATGRAATLEAIDWIAIARGGGSGDGLPLQRI
ncbi:YhdP family protein, partial [Lysobacter sp. 1R34A]|uniref:YhdP family protein n=1 Tax=Lysobacter sp. 1R34A TaxID=3445786 RepID=UPI003EE9DE61